MVPPFLSPTGTQFLRSHSLELVLDLTPTRHGLVAKKCSEDEELNRRMMLQFTIFDMVAAMLCNRNAAHVGHVHANQTLSLDVGCRIFLRILGAGVNLRNNGALHRC
jgi:hypothetical protein